MKERRYLLRLSPKGRNRHSFVGELRSVAGSVGARVSHERWTSYGALEVDVFAPSRKRFDLLLAAMGPYSRVESARDIGQGSSPKPAGEAMGEAVGYFNSERYWESHEALEGPWRSATGGERTLLQGIILVCAAMVHRQRGEEEVALGILGRARPMLEWAGGLYHGVDVGALRAQVERMIADRELSPPRI